MDNISVFAGNHPIISTIAGVYLFLIALYVLYKAVTKGPIKFFKRLDWTFNPQKYRNLDGQEIINPEIADQVANGELEFSNKLLSIPFPDDFKFPDVPHTNIAEFQLRKMRNYTLYYNNVSDDVNTGLWFVLLSETNKKLLNKKNSYIRFYLWRLIHTKMSHSAFSQFIYALSDGVYLMDELDDYTAYSDDQLKFLCLSCGNKNYYKIVRKDWTKEQWISLCDEFEKYQIRVPLLWPVYGGGLGMNILNMVYRYVFHDAFLFDRIFSSYSIFRDEGYHHNERPAYKPVFYYINEIKKSHKEAYDNMLKVNKEKNDFIREFRAKLVNA